MSEKENTIAEIKTLIRILNTYDNVLVPSLNDKEVNARERLNHFVVLAKDKFGMTLDDIQTAITIE